MTCNIYYKRMSTTKERLEQLKSERLSLNETIEHLNIKQHTIKILMNTVN